MSDALENRLQMLTKLPYGALQDEWIRIWGTAAPPGTPDHLIRGIAWKLQAPTCGVDVAKLEARLEKLAIHPHPIGALLDRTNNPKPGTHLIRNYRGDRLVVVVTDVGFFFNGTTYSSLTALASTITGRNTPGPAFFGLNTGRQTGSADD